MAAAVDNIQRYSYQYNSTIIEILEDTENRGWTETTSNLCLKLFHATVATGVSINDIDIAHRVRTRRTDEDRSKPIVCKLIRRLTKEDVMNRRHEIPNIGPTSLGLQAGFVMSIIKIFDHLTPNLQEVRQINLRRHISSIMFG